jgi:hypothetical protein
MFYSQAEDCFDRMRALEIACQDTSLPVDIDTVKQFLTKLHDLRKLVLESLMAALQDGKLLLEKLKDLSAEGTLDSRPDHIKTSAQFGKHLIDLHTALVSNIIKTCVTVVMCYVIRPGCHCGRAHSLLMVKENAVRYGVLTVVLP